MLRWPREHGVWLLVGALAVLLGLLAALQYYWTGEIGRAEAERQRTQLERAAQRFAREFGREVGRALMAFRPERPGREPVDARASLLARLERLRSTNHGGLVARLVLVTVSDSGSGGVIAEATDGAGSAFVEVPFPSSLQPLRDELEGREGGRPPRGGFQPGGFLTDPPSVVMPVVEPAAGASRRLRPGAFQLSGLVAIELDEGYLREELLPELAEFHFGPLDEGDYAVVALRARDDTILYSSDPGLDADELSQPDVRLELPFSFGGLGSPRDRFDRIRGPGGPLGRGDRFEPPPSRKEGKSGERPPPRRREADPRFGGPEGQGGPWVLAVRHRGGSLAEAVNAVRRRNLAVGLGILALLGTAAVVLAVGGQRARGLARQQLEFVAGVTHELHTPLAAIRSAGQNLADGVVSDPEQTRRYGHLIQKEGARLTALVAQVLDFAGIESGSRAYSSGPVDPGRLVHAVAGDLALVLEQAGMTVEVHVADATPEIRGDAEALRRALENLLTNAVKFAGEGGWVRVSAAPGLEDGIVELWVQDRGPGIPKAERARVLEPFYRGRDARQSQSPGSGLGLSLVRHVAEAHGGRVRVEAPDEGGTRVVMELPAAVRRPEGGTA